MRKKADQIELHGSVRAGKFTVPSGEEIYGTLTFDGSDTFLRLNGEVPAMVPFSELFGMTGRFLDGGRLVSLWRCNTLLLGETSADIAPSLIFVGEAHVDPEKEVIKSAKFLVDDTRVLFPDFKAFNWVVDPMPYIDQIANANARSLAEQTERDLKPEDLTVTGEAPLINYFAGKTELFSVTTDIGTISAHHYPSSSYENVDGVSITNRIYVHVDFATPINVDVMIQRSFKVLRFLELCSGRPQNVLRFFAQTIEMEYNNLEVYWPRPPKRKTEGEISEAPIAGSALVDPIHDPEEYAKVLAGWLNRSEEWRESLYQYFTCLHDQRIYGPERITAAANMFDVLPPSAVPPERSVSQDVLDAKAEARKLFRDLPEDDPDRHSVLNALGRVGKNNLRTKILHRAKIVSDNAAGRLQDLDLLVQEAVNCRNRYVHGTEGSFDYINHFSQFVLLTETLEFVFAVSALIEVGWDFTGWLTTKRRGGDHPFSKYLLTYKMDVGTLKKIIEKAKQEAKKD